MAGEKAPRPELIKDLEKVRDRFYGGPLADQMSFIQGLKNEGRSDLIKLVNRGYSNGGQFKGTF